MSAPQIRFRPVGPPQFSLVEDLARRIWPVCFAPIISAAQCEYMLRQRYTPEALSKALADGMTYELIDVDDSVGGFGAQGPTQVPSEWKLWQVYVLPDQQGRGLGRCYIEHVAQAARRRGCSSLVLTVNKGNLGARRLYERCGFSVRESACFDIGNGFVMDDDVMVKPLTDLSEGPAIEAP